MLSPRVVETITDEQFFQRRHLHPVQSLCTVDVVIAQVDELEVWESDVANVVSNKGMLVIP